MKSAIINPTTAIWKMRNKSKYISILFSKPIIRMYETTCIVFQR